MLLTVTEFAEAARLSRDTVYRYIKRGDIVPVRLTHRGAIRIDDTYLQPQELHPIEKRLPPTPIEKQPVSLMDFKNGKEFKAFIRNALKQQEADKKNQRK